MREKADTRKLKVYCETTVIGDMTSRPSPLIRNLARQMITREWWDAMAPQSEFYVCNVELSPHKQSPDNAQDYCRVRTEWI